MGALVWDRRLVLVVVGGAFASVALAMACGSPASSPSPVGVSLRGGGGVNPHLGSDASIVDGTSALPRDYRTRFKKMNHARFVSSGHAAGRWEVDVWANEEARAALALRARDVPEGATVVQEHFERQGEGGSVRGPIMVMEKREKGFAPSHGDWSFTVVGSAGQLVKQGVIEQCAGCHDDAPVGGLFPIVE